MIVWDAATTSSGDQRLHAYDGDTGAIIYAGGGTNELMTGTRQWNTGMVARGRIYFGADNRVYAFRLPAGTPTPTPTASPLLLRPQPLLQLLLPQLLQLQQPRLLLRQLPRDCDSHANCDSDANCHSLRFRQSDTDTQTNAHSETPHDTEAAPESVAKAGRSEPVIR